MISSQHGLLTSPDESLLSHHIDTVRLAISPYCCGPGEFFSLEPIRDNCSYTHDNTYLWLDMNWERLRNKSQRESIRLIYMLCAEVLAGPVLRRIVLMTGQAPSASAIRASRDSTVPAPIRLSSHPHIEYHSGLVVEKLDQEDLVPVARTMKNGSEIVYGWRKPNGPMVVSFDPIVAGDESYNRRRRQSRRLLKSSAKVVTTVTTVRGSKSKVSRGGRHQKPKRPSKTDTQN